MVKNPEKCEGEPRRISSTCSEVWWMARQTNDEHGVGASEFQLLTSTTMLIFELEKVEVVVLEVDMCDRLDTKRAHRCARLGLCGLLGDSGAHGPGGREGEGKDSEEGETVRAREAAVCGSGQRGEGGVA